MAHEIFHTYVTQGGFRADAVGFCTVAATDGTPTPVIDRLESLSGYEMLFRAGSGREKLNPPLFAHYLPTTAGYARHFLSVVRYTDNTCPGGRPNKLAHHLVLDGSEELSPGPAWLLRHSGVADEPWDGKPGVIPEPRQLPTGSNPARYCEAWEKATGDAGWAGAIVQQFILDSNRPAYVIYRPGIDVLALVDEALSLLEPEDRWRVSFSTYFTRPLPGVHCCWRFVADGTLAADKAREARDAGLTVIDLTGDSLGTAPESKHSELARSAPRVAVEEITAEDRTRDKHRARETAAAEAESAKRYMEEARALRPAAAPAPLPSRTPVLFWVIALVWPVIALFVAYNRMQQVQAVELSQAQQRILYLEEQLARAQTALGELIEAVPEPGAPLPGPVPALPVEPEPAPADETGANP